MQIVNWKSELHSVNVDEIDQQHQHLFHLLNKLFDSMSKGSDKEVLREVLTELMDYTHYHFGCEEAHFCELSRYKCKEKHKEEHQEFVDHIQSFYNDFVSGNKLLTMDIFIYLKDWINKHIRQVDKSYAGMK